MKSGGLGATVTGTQADQPFSTKVRTHFWQGSGSTRTLGTLVSIPSAELDIG